MIKTKSLLFLVLFIIFGCNNKRIEEKVNVTVKSICEIENPRNDLTRKKLNGRVKSVKEFEFELVKKFGELVKDEDTKSGTHYYYNRKHYLIKEEYYSKDVLSKKILCQYDDKGYRIKENVFSDKRKNNTFRTFETYTSTYDIKGKEVESKYLINDNLVNMSTYIYDDEKLIEKNKYDDEGILLERQKYKYDSKGNNIEIACYNADGSVDWLEKNEYYEKGNVIKSINKNFTHDFTHIFYKRYDDNGNNISTEMYLNDGIDPSFYYYKYDQNGYRIERIKRQKYSEEDKVTWIYEFDIKNNWTKQTKIGKDISVIERDIEYYD